MDVFLTPEQESELVHIAQVTGRGTDEIIQEAVGRFLAYRRWLAAQTEPARDSFRRGDFHEHEGVVALIEQDLRS